MTKVCTRCSTVGIATRDFRPQRTICRKCESKARMARVRRETPLLDEVEAKAQNTFIRTGKWPDDGRNSRFPSVEAFDTQVEIEKSEVVTDLTGLSQAPEGYYVKGESTLFDGEGNVKAKWVKTNKEQEERYLAMVKSFTAISEPLRSLANPIPQQANYNDDLLAVYPMGDPHLGMMAWPAETGNAFDLKIAEDNLFAAVDHLVGLAPPASQAIIMNLGDFFHADSKKNETTKGTAVDVDNRWPKVLATGIRVMRRLIDRALEKHKHVTVINEIGNHDDHTSIMLSIALAQFYEREPRVTIDTSPEPFHWYRFGKVLIGVHHGDKTKNANLLGVMACDRAKDWGETLHRYWYIGHVHHDSLKEYPGVTVESFRTLAGRDAWHHGQGYRSGKDMKLDIIHREYGKINRYIIGIEQINHLIPHQ